MLREVLIVLGLTLLNGVFAGAEIALISIRRTRLRELEAGGSRAARAVARLKANPERLLATTQVGITVLGATAAAFGGSSVERKLAPLLARLPWVGAYAEPLALVVVVSVVSFLSLVLGELVPKSLALRAGERYALWVSRPLLALATLARPLIRVLLWTSNLVLKLFGDRTSFTESRLSREELHQLVEEAAEAGEVDARAGEIAARALDFGSLTAGDVMVPRNRIKAIPRRATAEELERILLEEGYARMPVYEGTLDEVVGYLTAKDALSLAFQRGLVVVDDLLRPTHFVPETMPATRVLQDLQKRRAQLAIVVDEHGAVAGLLTIEDLMEELVGEIFSEGESPDDAIRAQPDGTALVRADAPVRDVNRTLNLDLPVGEDWSTVGGLCTWLAGAIPSRGTVLSLDDGSRIEVLEVGPRSVELVRVRPPPQPERPASEADA